MLSECLENWSQLLWLGSNEWLLMGFELLAPSCYWGSLFCNTQLRLIHGKFRGRGGELKWEGNAWSFLLLLLSLICPVLNMNASCTFSGATHVIAFFACGPCVQFSTGLDRSYALFFKLSLLTFLFLLFLNEVVNVFFTACNYEVVMFLRHFTPTNVFLCCLFIVCILICLSYEKPKI